MWPTILRDLERLKSLDKNLVLEEAKAHKYSFHPPATEAELQRAEERLEIAIPPELRMVYSQIGNGGAGPDTGLVSLAELEGLHANEPWPGIAVVEDNDFDLSSISGVVAVAERYYNYKSCVVVSGADVGKVIAYEEGAFAYLEGDSLASVYSKWLDKRLSLFSGFAHAFTLSSDIQEIAANQFLANDLHPENTLLVAASLLGWSDFDLAMSKKAIVWERSGKEANFSLDIKVVAEFANRIKHFHCNS